MVSENIRNISNIKILGCAFGAFFFMILRFFQFKIHYFWVFLVLFNYILPRYKEGNGVLISGEKRRPLFMLSHTAQKGDFGASNIRKTIVFEVPLFFLRIASAHFYEDVVLLCFLPICFLMLSFFFVSFRKKVFSFNIRLFINFLSSF